MPVACLAPSDTLANCLLLGGDDKTILYEDGFRLDTAKKIQIILGGSDILAGFKDRCWI